MFEWMSVETLKYYTNEVKKAIEKILAKVAKTGDFNDLINKPNKVIDITQEDYDALPTSDKMNPEIYYNILNAPGGGGTPSSGWDSLDGKPFETLGDGFYVEQYELNLETRLVDITQEDYDNLNTDDLFDPHVFWNIKNPREEAVDYSKWGNIQEKPFEAIGEGLEVDNDELFVSKRLIDITQEDYDSLTTELQMDPHIFWHITDAYGGGGVYDILMTKEELEANTEPGKLVDSLVIKDMSDSLNGIDLRVNPETGKPEWKERGADTYSPFSGDANGMVLGCWTVGNWTNTNVKAEDALCVHCAITSSVGNWTLPTSSGAYLIKDGVIVDSKYYNTGNVTNPQVGARVSDSGYIEVGNLRGNEYPLLWCVFTK